MRFWMKSGKYARITITHFCFIALTLAGPLGRCLNTQPAEGIVFKQLPQELSSTALFVSQLYKDKSLALRAPDLTFFSTDLQTVN